MTCCAAAHSLVWTQDTDTRLAAADGFAAQPQRPVLHARNGGPGGWAAALRGFFGHGSAAGSAAAGTGRAIDVHAHFFPQSYLKALAEGGPPAHFPLDMSKPEAPTIARGTFRLTLDPSYWDLEARVKRMDATGVTVQALSLTAPMVHWAPPKRGAELARLFNDAVEEAHTAFPGRFVGCAALPLQDPALALAELNRVGKRRSIRGVYLPTNTGGGELGAKALFPIYERAQALGLPLLLHPVGVIGAERLQPFYLNNLLGNPFDTAVAAAHFVFGGVLDRFPKLEIVLPHGGGALPALWGRLQHGQGVRPETKGVARRPFGEYLRCFHYDTITHAPEILKYWIGIVGADRITLGSDYCFDMGYERPREMVGKLGLSAADREKIFAGNAARLLKL
jgi:aminocarboxymuconate-semialdehyde decarboxylase